jgi:hypothetical protein
MTNASKILVGKLEVKKDNLIRTRSRWEENTNM